MGKLEDMGKKGIYYALLIFAIVLVVKHPVESTNFFIDVMYNSIRWIHTQGMDFYNFMTN
ncbi:hypothetical protein [Paenibacillus polymyxa]|uniref:hypothetical protein n=1 Tax=Paenibacillus polymyxa TaxID=1406 RepID=UPI000D82119F|nr:hypothetical protein [Paenibacillus polymyxa]MDU8675335.1 hypothetical protein [Paenibacillus polymyxa]MDU8700242.1 hypothetical protein [Paenibacillus polymyxa]URJ54859.1 hypothetical protein MF623_004258 [Paenibacillus polymyxa]URJ66702.1 hypothetical protein MF620_001604 [Paenibacillus polymyxa]URJ69372.1 hypothetical protein MF624_004239 [Paenibacillus polymyxa]